MLAVALHTTTSVAPGFAAQLAVHVCTVPEVVQLQLLLLLLGEGLFAVVQVAAA